MGVTRAELFKLAEQGKIASDEFIPKFSDELEKRTKKGVPDALNKTFTAVGRLKTAFQEWVDVLFRSGVDELFATVLNILSDLFTITKPFVALFGSAFFTVLRNILSVFEFIFAILADIIKLIDYGVKKLLKTFGISAGLSEVMMLLGTIIGHLITLFAGAFTKGIQATKYIVGEFSTLGGIFTWFRNLWDDIVKLIQKAMSYMPTLNFAAQKAAPAGKALAGLGGKVSAGAIEKSSRVAGGINFAKGTGRDVYVHINKKDGTDELIDAHVEEGTSSKLNHDSRE